MWNILSWVICGREEKLTFTVTHHPWLTKGPHSWWVMYHITDVNKDGPCLPISLALYKLGQNNQNMEDVILN